MVSYPGYDSNKLANGVDSEYFASLQHDKSSPLLNYATQQKTAPGSTFKLVSATAGLAENVITTSDQIRCTGIYNDISNKPKCWIYPGSHGLDNVSGQFGIPVTSFSIRSATGWHRKKQDLIMMPTVLI